LVKKTQHELNNPADANQKSEAKIDPDVKRLETTLSENFGTHVQIAHNQKGKGKVVINFGDLEQLDGILEKMRLNES
jgi:ParB family chromosome partitioning protein